MRARIVVEHYSGKVHYSDSSVMTEEELGDLISLSKKDLNYLNIKCNGNDTIIKENYLTNCVITIEILEK